MLAVGAFRCPVAIENTIWAGFASEVNMDANRYEFSTEEFADTSFLTKADLERLGFRTSENNSSIQLQNGTLSLIGFDSLAGGSFQFTDSEGTTIDVNPQQETLGDVKYLIWRLNRILELPSMLGPS
jgi:hypothetical protein